MDNTDFPTDENNQTGEEGTTQKVQRTLLPYEMETRFGHIVNLREPEPDMIDLLDILWSLSRQQRYNGHTHRLYSVMDHTIIMALVMKDIKENPEYAPFSLQEYSDKITDKTLKLAILHDAAEAYTGDVIGPMRQVMYGNNIKSYLENSAFDEIESGIEKCILQKFNISMDEEEAMDNALLIKEFDVMMIRWEQKEVMKSTNDWGFGEEFKGILEYFAFAPQCENSYFRFAYLNNCDSLPLLKPDVYEWFIDLLIDLKLIPDNLTKTYYLKLMYPIYPEYIIKSIRYELGIKQ